MSETGVITVKVVEESRGKIVSESVAGKLGVNYKFSGEGGLSENK